MAGDIDALVAQSRSRSAVCWFCDLPSDHAAHPYLVEVLKLENASPRAVWRILRDHFDVSVSESVVQRWLRGEYQCH